MNEKEYDYDMEDQDASEDYEDEDWEDTEWDEHVNDALRIDYFA